MTIRSTACIHAIGLLALAGLSGCGSSDDPLARFKEQAPNWQPCADERLDATAAKLAQQLGARVSCADLRAPLDYANPALGEIRLAVLRVQAESADSDHQAILINPGGPGLDGLLWPINLSVYWSMEQTTDDPAVVRDYQAMAQRYDLIGFSPRGTGWSTRLECSRTQDPLPVEDPTRQLDPANTDKTLFNSQLIAQGCKDQALMQHIHTDATARDMDLIRQVLHQDKLNYIGLSYGTWLGNWYASLFPQRVGRMLLSGVTDFSIPLNHQSLPQDQGRQVVLDSVLIPYATRHPDRFGLPATVFAIRQMINSLSDPLHAALVNTMIDGNLLSNANLSDHAALTLRAAEVLHNILQASPGIDQASLLEQVATTDFVPPTSTPLLNDLARTAAQELVNRYFKPMIQKEDMFWSVVCNDSGTGFTPETWVQQSNSNARLYPDFGGAVRDNACLYWPLPHLIRPPQYQAAQAGNILMLQSAMDPLTVLSGAMNALYLLPNASMIVIDGEITHAPLPPYGTGCVDRPIAEYFLNGKIPARTSNCQGRPLPADADNLSNNP